jgi:phosphatidate cytidylyltransferase
MAVRGELAQGRPAGNVVSRVAVAVIGLPLVLGLVWLGGWWLFVLAAVVGLLALHEYYAMTRPLRPIVIAGYLGLILTLLAAQIGGFAWIPGGLATTFALAFLLKGIADTRQSATVAVGATILGVAWIGLGLVFIMLLRALPDHGRLASFTLLLAVWAGDTAAFFVGRLVGRHKLAPRISPGKTWEGLVAGTAATIFVTFVALYQDRNEFLSIGQALLLGLTIAVAAPLGDLFESLLKRDMGVKDTGSMLGGHGGVLDRIDAPLFASVAAFYVILAFDKV